MYYVQLCLKKLSNLSKLPCIMVWVRRGIRSYCNFMSKISNLLQPLHGSNFSQSNTELSQRYNKFGTIKQSSL